MSYLDQLNAQIEEAEALEMAEENIQKGGRLMRQSRPVLTGAPKFKAQFDLEVGYFILYPGGIIVPTAFDNNQLPLAIFGKSDFQGNYNDALGIYNLPPNIRYDGVVIYPGGSVGIIPGVNQGDLVLTFTDTILSLRCFVVVKCKNVAYGSLLDATGSDRFVTNLVRMSLPSTTILSQFDQNFSFNKLSLFGKTERDQVSPLSYKNPNQQQVNIIDIDMAFPIFKETCLSTTTKIIPANTYQTAFSLSVFVTRFIKTAINV